MKNYLVICITILYVNKGLTQNVNLDYKSAIKIYNLMAFDEYKETKSDTTTNSKKSTTATLQILHPTIAFQWKTKKNNFHEIELINFELAKVAAQTEIVNNGTGNGQLMSGNDIRTTAISARYEYILNFNKSKDKKLVPSLGFGINPYFRQNNYIPKISNSFPSSESFIGARTFIIPRLAYYINPKFFIDINIPLCFSDTYYLKGKDDDSTLPANKRITTTYNVDLFPQIFSGRLGVGLKF